MLQRISSHLLLGVVSLCSLQAAQGATLEVASETSIYTTQALSAVFRTIRMKGLIEVGDAEKFRSLLVKLKTSATAKPEGPIVVELNGAGGDLLEGIKVGDVLREFHVTTVVRKGDLCLGACTVAFVGGSARDPAFGPAVPSRYIEIGGTVGMPNFYNPPPLRTQPSKYPVESLLAYSARMGIEKGLRARLLGEAPDKILYMSTVEGFLVLSTCPIGLGLPSTSQSVQATNVCTQSTRSLDMHLPLRTTAITEADARLSLLKYVKMHIWWLGVVGHPHFMTTPTLPPLESKLADRLKSDQFTQSEEEARQVYTELIAAGIPLPELLGATFEVSGYSTVNDRITCIASLSPNDADRYDVIIQGPDGMRKGSQFAPKHCRSLFRYDMNDAINPRNE